MAKTETVSSVAFKLWRLEFTYLGLVISIWLTHWGRVTHICVSKLTIIGSDNGLSPGRRQAIIWTSAGILLIRPLGTNFNKMLIKILTFSFMKMLLKVSSAKRRPFSLCLNVLTESLTVISAEWVCDTDLMSKGLADCHWAPCMLNVSFLENMKY